MKYCKMKVPKIYIQITLYEALEALYTPLSELLSLSKLLGINVTFSRD